MGMTLEQPALKYLVCFVKIADWNPFSPGTAHEMVTFLLLAAITRQAD